MSQDSISIALEPRSVTGKAVKHLRKDGTLPAVIHDHGKESVLVQGSYVELFKIWQKAGKHHPVDIKAGDKKFTALIKVADFDPKKHTLTHLVFNAVDKDQAVEAEIPIHAKYNEGNDVSPAEKSGYIVLSQLDTVLVKAVASKLPDFVEYDAEKLEKIGDHATVSDLIIPEGVEVMIEAEHSIATVYEPSALAAANDAAGGDAEAESEPAEGEEAEEGAEKAEVKTEEADKKD
ncbi:50S ribosomal protein L25 [bacterium]|jgi:large subunit ribosomal protein L25|nr:50S ribosomal protein L25 [bacterium]